MGTNNFIQHPIYINYFANENGYIMNNKRKKVIRGKLHNNTYQISIFHNKQLCVQVPRFVWECFNGLIIERRKLVMHKDGNPNNNCIENLKLINSSPNSKTIKVTNINTNEIKNYESINECLKDLKINRNTIMKYCSNKSVYDKYKFQLE